MSFTFYASIIYKMYITLTAYKVTHSQLNTLYTDFNKIAFKHVYIVYNFKVSQWFSYYEYK